MNEKSFHTGPMGSREWNEILEGAVGTEDGERLYLADALVVHDAALRNLVADLEGALDIFVSMRWLEVGSAGPQDWYGTPAVVTSTFLSDARGVLERARRLRGQP